MLLSRRPLAFSSPARVFRPGITTCSLERECLLVSDDRRYLIAISRYLETETSLARDVACLFFSRPFLSLPPPAFVSGNLCACSIFLLRLFNKSVYQTELHRSLHFRTTNGTPLAIFIFTGGSRGFQLIRNCQHQLSLSPSPFLFLTECQCLRCFTH